MMKDLTEAVNQLESLINRFLEEIDPPRKTIPREEPVSGEIQHAAQVPAQCRTPFDLREYLATRPPRNVGLVLDENEKPIECLVHAAGQCPYRLPKADGLGPLEVEQVRQALRQSAGVPPRRVF